MTRLRQTVAKRLKSAQETAALLTTFNDVDMTAVMEARAKYKDLFEKKHGVRLGFMGFFTKAVTHALKEIPSVNAEIDGTDIIFKNYAHIGVAVGTEKGLVVPVVRNGEIVIRPMMYLALSYDHRLIDGREAVTFLVAVKNAIEDPTRLLIDL